MILSLCVSLLAMTFCRICQHWRFVRYVHRWAWIYDTNVNGVHLSDFIFVFIFRVQSTCWWQFTRRNLGLWAGTWLMEARYLLIRFISCISCKWFRSFNFITSNFITSNFIWLFLLVFFGRLFYIFHDLFFLSQICAGWSILFKLLDLMRIEYSRKEHDSIRYFSLLD